MKVSSNSAQFNNITDIGVNARYYIPSANYRKDIYTTAPETLSTKKANPSVLNQYSPKLLLSLYSKPEYIEQVIKSNPNIIKLLESKGIKPEIHPENVLNMRNSHLQTTNIIAQQIANKLGLSQMDKKILEQAAIFHDFGKILIPKEILNKPEELTDAEKSIISIHAELGYELLSKSGINQRALELIKNHHTPQNTDDILCQILSVADIYSALREERSYKKPLTNSQALQILDQKAQSGKVSTEVVDALKNICKAVAA